MCYPVSCATCGKTTWAGCGEHIDKVRERVPADEWCDGDHDGTATADSRRGSLLDRILRR